jgi:Ca-activated chloride channel family protein
MKIPLFPDVTFANPAFFLLFLLLPIILYFWYKKVRKAGTFFYTTIATPRVLTWKIVLNEIRPLFFILGLSGLIFALARPQKIYNEVKNYAEGIDIMLVMDLSGSMLARDFDPDRLEVSKKTAIEFIDKRTFDRIGLIIFSGEALTKCPLTTDHNILKDIITELRCGILEDGTAIGMGLAAGVNRLKNSTSKSKVLILLTDGENNAGYISPEVAAKLAQDFKIKLYTIGVGSNGFANMPTARDAIGNIIFEFKEVKIDEKLLQEMANQTGGKYFRATSKDKLTSIYEEIDKLEKSKNEVITSLKYQELFYKFIYFSIAFLFFNFIIKYFILRKL